MDQIRRFSVSRPTFLGRSKISIHKLEIRGGGEKKERERNEWIKINSVRKSDAERERERERERGRERERERERERPLGKKEKVMVVNLYYIPN